MPANIYLHGGVKGCQWGGSGAAKDVKKASREVSLGRQSNYGGVNLTILAIQHFLGEVWNLNGETLSYIQAGHLVSSAPSANAALDVMWLSVDLVVTGREVMAQLLSLKTEFLDAHTIHENSSDVIFYRRISDSNPDMTLVPVNIEHAGRAIHTAVDLPSQPSRPRGTNASLKDTMFSMVKRSSVTKNTNLNQHHPIVRRSRRLRSASRRGPRVGT
ncbi:hypothetical protein B0H13DRAFT_1922938 [Mycena leptocephala]|nr:hypothetical protein B0H13DRAFT_1922938 [Mycena leptocephala]